MVPPLPSNIQQNLDHTMAQWQQWQCSQPLQAPPKIVAQLSSGIGNFSVLVESGQRFVIRLDGLDPPAHGLSRQAEWRTLQVAQQAQLAPAPRYFNPELGCLVCDYLPPDAQQAAQMTDVADLLRGIHALPSRHHRLDLGERILRYEKRVSQGDTALGNAVISCSDNIKQLLQDAARNAAALVLCHHDLLKANRLYSGGKLWALDWEYSAMGDPLYDLAVIIHGDELEHSQAEELCHCYLGRKTNEQERQSIERYGCVYRYLELLWYLALERESLDETGISAKLASLQSLIAR